MLFKGLQESCVGLMIRAQVVVAVSSNYYVVVRSGGYGVNQLPQVIEAFV